MVLVVDALDPKDKASVTRPEPLPSLAGAGRGELCAALTSVGVPDKQLRMRVNQLWSWMYVRGVPSFDAMTDVSKDLRARLAERYSLDRPEIVSEQVSQDGTRKWLLRLRRSGTEVAAPEIETVYIPESDRGTLCISSQVGCTLTCTFCHTGTQRLVRNLSADEIVAQILVARDRIGDWPDAVAPDDGRLLPSTERKITNIVLMGMGEPLYNFDNVKAAMAIASDGEGLSVSKRRITLSTSGVVPEIARWGGEAQTMLAISLHAVRDDLRNELVPINKKYPISELLDACRSYPGLSNARRITFEYVMLKGVNDSLADAKALVQLLKGIPAKINLIPFNPWPGSQYECSDWEQIERFAEVVNKAGYASPVRTPRGRDIFAACGQLKSESLKIRASARGGSVTQSGTAGSGQGA
ncbi:23S rRNA m(2)A-2503 methyltransferase [Filomicrobium insigne]|uniref:Dual-specificity RNA methyltransferase RlmN n=1 Tax=Filomicrobium insigne TaxID=418854 RepID=A0A1H0TY04_9HYPH|nr:23S rRNA (adenine(2503)-C(2))-methyltransferase RlmN [Filomicrobium insigne]SDP58814.1 23S rRNA m(2)A-2503 methyltransferase [Filomicrobium insigne]